MTTVRFQPLLGQTQKGFEISDTAWDSFVNLKNKLNRFSLFAAILGLLFLGALGGSRGSLVGFITLSIWGAALFLYARSVARGIEIRRHSTSRARESDKFEIEYEITNSSQFAAAGFYILDQFTGSKLAQVYHEESKSLSPLRRRKVFAEVLCDNGMGKFELGPLWIVVADPLGIFSFVIEHQELQAIEVFPQVKELADIRLTGTKHSDSFGIYDQLNPGSSTSFMGIRPYVSGDPVKYISWKLSAKTQELVVKVFDHSVADDVSIILDLSPKVHMGARSESTWHMMKELSLSLTRQCLDHGNRVQVISQNLFVPWGRGEDYWADATMRVGLHTPEFLKDKAEVGHKLEDYLELLPIGSTVFFATTFVMTFPDDTFELLEKIRARSIDVFVFMIDSMSFVRGSYPLTLWSHFAANTGSRAKHLDNAKVRLNSIGIPTYTFSMGEDMGLKILEGSLR